MTSEAPSQAAATQWFYAATNQRIGPIDAASFQQLISAGQVRPETLVWRAGMAEWAAAGSLAELAQAMAAAAGVRAAAPPIVPGQLSVPYTPGIGDDAGMRMLLPVGRSGLAIAAGYVGLFSVLGIFAPVALILGLVAVWHIRRNPRLHGLGRAWFAIIMGALFTLLYGGMLISAMLHP